VLIDIVKHHGFEEVAGGASFAAFAQYAPAVATSLPRGAKATHSEFGGDWLIDDLKLPPLSF
jgi:hypothetical protein